jgi:hypothetical protein
MFRTQIKPHQSEETQRVGVTDRDTLLLEIETSEIRHEWARAEMHRAGNSRELGYYVVESLRELQMARTTCVEAS